MKSTRERILEIMETRQQVGSQELARLTHVTPANIRHHLRQLSREGLIQKTGEHVIAGRGRPTPLYTLTHPRSNIADLAGHLLTQLSGQQDGTEQCRKDAACGHAIGRTGEQEFEGNDRTTLVQQGTQDEHHGQNQQPGHQAERRFYQAFVSQVFAVA